MPLECRSKGVRAPKAQVPDQPVCENTILSAMASLVVPHASHIIQTWLPWKETRGFLTGIRKNPKPASDGDSNPLLNPKRQDPVLAVCTILYSFIEYCMRSVWLLLCGSNQATWMLCMGDMATTWKMCSHGSLLRCSSMASFTTLVLQTHVNLDYRTLTSPCYRG